MSRLDQFHENLTEFAQRAKQANDLDTILKVKQDILDLITQARDLLDRAKKNPLAVLEDNIQHYKEMHDYQKSTNEGLRKQIKVFQRHNNHLQKHTKQLQEQCSQLQKRLQLARGKQVVRTKEPIIHDKEMKRKRKKNKRPKTRKTTMLGWRAD